jgi:hypothetical protein
LALNFANNLSSLTGAMLLYLALLIFAWRLAYLHVCLESFPPCIEGIVVLRRQRNLVCQIGRASTKLDRMNLMNMFSSISARIASFNFPNKPIRTAASTRGLRRRKACDQTSEYMFNNHKLPISSTGPWASPSRPRGLCRIVSAKPCA